MPARSDDVKPLGEVVCPVGGQVAYVYKARGRRQTLYSRCECCGCNQGNGPAFQRALSQFVPVGSINRGAIGQQTGAAPVTEPKPEPKEAGATPVTEPTREPAPDDFDPDAEPVQEPKKPGRVGLLLTLLAAGAGVYTIVKG